MTQCQKWCRWKIPIDNINWICIEGLRHWLDVLPCGINKSQTSQQYTLILIVVHNKHQLIMPLGLPCCTGTCYLPWRPDTGSDKRISYFHRHHLTQTKYTYIITKHLHAFHMHSMVAVCQPVLRNINYYYWLSEYKQQRINTSRLKNSYCFNNPTK